MTTNLGALLAANIQREKLAETNKAAAMELKRTEEARAAFEKVAEFFEKAKTQFTEGITSGAPVKDLFLQVGGRRYSNVSECHEDVDLVIKGYDKAIPEPTSMGSGRLKPNPMPKTLLDPKQFGPLWLDFQQWAAAAGLSANWQYCWDGGGMDSWWQLRVTPATH